MSKNQHLVADHYYHIYNRGNSGEDLFYHAGDYKRFFALYIQHLYPVTETYAYCLMKNHFHLFLKIVPKSEQAQCFDHLAYARQFSNFFNAYTKYINIKYHRHGSLFERPFKRVLVTEERHCLHLISYIHRNPQKHGFSDDFRTYPHSSYQTLKQQKNSRLAIAQVMLWFGQQFEFYHQQLDDNLISELVAEDE